MTQGFCDLGTPMRRIQTVRTFRSRSVRHYDTFEQGSSVRCSDRASMSPQRSCSSAWRRITAASTTTGSDCRHSSARTCGPRDHNERTRRGYRRPRPTRVKAHSALRTPPRLSSRASVSIRSTRSSASETFATSTPTHTPFPTPRGTMGRPRALSSKTNVAVAGGSSPIFSIRSSTLPMTPTASWSDM